MHTWQLEETNQSWNNTFSYNVTSGSIRNCFTISPDLICPDSLALPVLDHSTFCIWPVNTSAEGYLIQDITLSDESK